jgi:catechol 2,3-dioxygenase-like lactoylglutathione lyase family enzyme
LKHHHTAIEVQDLEAAIEWYGSKLGFVFDRRFELPEAQIEIAYMTTDSFRIELLRRADSVPEPERFRPSMHICFEVDDLNAAEAALERKGVEFAQRPKLIGPARVRNLWIRDHEGHLIEFLEPLD